MVQGLGVRVRVRDVFGGSDILEPPACRPSASANPKPPTANPDEAKQNRKTAVESILAEMLGPLLWVQGKFRDLGFRAEGFGTNQLHPFRTAWQTKKGTLSGVYLGETSAQQVP